MIAQSQLHLLDLARHEAARAREQLRILGALVFDHLEHGVGLESGAHVAEIRELREPGRVCRVLFVNGRALLEES